MVIAIARTRLGFTCSFLLNASIITFALPGWSRSISSGAFSTLDVSLGVANISSGKPLLVLRPTHTSDSSQLGKYFRILHCLTLVTLAYNFSFLIVQTILAFPRVLDDMETLQLASLHEPNLCGIQLVVVLVIDKSSEQ
ncbi:hypothetical protein Tco_0328375 [Tanacetum coccineum]